MYRIFPAPKQCTFQQNTISGIRYGAVTTAPEIEASCRDAGFDPAALLAEAFPGGYSPDGITLAAEYVTCSPESFHICISSDGIRITCQDGAGYFYALGVLVQLAAQADGVLPCAEIADEPSLSVRGIMLDIGRDKIPSMETLKGLIDLFASMRINHLQLYMEGFSFDYEDFHYLFTNETPVTPEEFRELSQYARAHFIDLVPNQNVLGHMEKWLEKPQFRSLAECEDGYIFENLFWRPPMTLDVRDSRSFELAETLLGTLMDASSSGCINVNMDEPFELGMGKNKQAAEKEGRLNLYFEYVEKLHAYCASRGKRMLMWGDEILHHPDCVSRFPKDAILLDWIYEGDAHFEDHARLMQKTGLNYCLCPGTSSWGSLTGRSDNMAKNIRDAASCAIRYGGLGIITTDWGDLGHWQYLSASYPGFAYTAACSWSGPESDSDLTAWFCNRFSIPPREPAICIDFAAMKEYLDQVEKEVSEAALACADGELIRREMENGLRMVRHGIHLYYTMTVLRDDPGAFSREMAVLFDDLDDILKVHYTLWSARNRSGGFQRSTAHMNHLLFFYRKMQKANEQAAT